MLTVPVLALACVSALRGADDLSRFSQVLIRPASAPFYIASVTMSFQPFIRHRATFSSTYTARVFPYFFLGEKGRIWINIPDEALALVGRGEPVDFTGRAVNDSGDERKVEGRATPTGPWAGRIKVRVFVSKRIILTYNTTYELQGPRGEPPAVTPTPAR